MFQVLRLLKIGNEDPQEFKVIYKDLENKDQGYTQTIRTGTEPQLRTLLKDGGISDPDIDNLFKDVKAHQ